jgi:hypothetical protein
MDIPALEELQIIGALSTALLAVEASGRVHKIQKRGYKDGKTY